MITPVGKIHSTSVLCTDGRFSVKCPVGQALNTLAQISALNYQGAFRLPGDTFGYSRLAYQSRPVIGLNKSTGGLLITGGSLPGVKAMGEFSIPALVQETGGVFANLNMAVNTQPFINVLDQDKVNGGDFELGREISGLYEKVG